MVLVTSATQGHQALAAGALRCPGCAAALRPWGWTTPRRIRGRDGWIELMRLRRARCRACSSTHVLLPSTWLPRRLDEVDLIGSALLGAACGDGHRPLAARLNRPQGTVRGWLRAARDQAGRLHAELAAVGAQLPEHHLGMTPAPPTALGEAVEAAGLVAAAYRRALLPGPVPPPWQLLSVLTNGRLLTGAALAPS